MSGTDYCDIEIHIRKPSDDSYPVSVRVPSEDRRAEGAFISPYTEGEINRALAWMEQGAFDAAYVKEFGAKLFGALFVDEIKAIYEGSRQSAGVPLRFRLIIDAARAARIPWELLYDPDREVFLSLEGPFVRGTSLIEPTRPLVVSPPLRILVVDAFPQGVAELASQVETADIQRALADLVRRRLVEVHTLSHATLAGLQNALREAVNPEQPRPFHLLHFIGHGHHDAASERTVLLFEDDNGKIDEVDAEALTNVLRPYDLKLVFLNACQSMQSSALDLAQGFAPALLRNGVPAVVGMQVAVLDELALKFSHDFYAALADNRPVDVALADARQLARGTRHRQKADLAIPVCYLRTATGQILELERPEQIPLTRATWRPWLRERATPRRVAVGTFGVISFMSTLLGLYWGILPFFDGPDRMTGAFNVAIAEFGAVDSQGRAVASEPGRNLAESVYRTLDDEVQSLKGSGTLAGFDIQLSGPSELGRITGATIEERTRAAARQAEAYNIDVIVYGNLDLGEDTTGFIPEFYLSDRTLRDAEELIGQYNFGSQVQSPGNVETNPVVSKELNDALRDRTRALTHFVIGLGYYLLDRYDRAAEYFSAAEQTPGWADADGKEVLYLFLGNTANRLRDLDQAGQYYARALRLNEEYARARIGVAEVEFLRARGGACSAETVDLDGLQRAIDGFMSAQTARDQPPRAAIESKVAFGIGRVYLCLSLAGVEDHWADAEQQFQAVIADHERDDDRVKKQLASESFANLGLLYWVRLAAEDAVASNQRQAIEHYRRAIELSRFPDRQALFYSMLSQLYAGLGQTGESDRAIAEAIRLDPDSRERYEELQERLKEQLGDPMQPVIGTPGS